MADQQSEGHGEQEIKGAVRETYGRVATGAQCCLSSCCIEGADEPVIGHPHYAELEPGEVPQAALQASAGCANPVALVSLDPGEVVLDLGCGGGVDALLAARRVGPTGRVYGLDMTDEMLELARQNQQEAGLDNVEFLKGEIEHLPLPDASVDVIISNCVINLSADKQRVVQEAFRVLKPGGRLAVADVLATGPVPLPLRQHLGLWAGCVAGALEQEEFKCKLQQAGFVDAEVEILGVFLDPSNWSPPEEVRQALAAAPLEEAVPTFVSGIVRARKPACTCC